MATERRATGWRAPAMLLGLLVLFCAPMLSTPDGFLSGDSYRDNDWLTDRFFDLAARKTLLEEGAFPLRSHLIGGGYPTLGQPFDGSWAPTLLAILLFGPVLGVKLNLFLLLALGTWGVWRLSRDWLGLDQGPAGFAAASFAVSGWLPSMMLVGFYPQVFYMAAPGALALLLTPRRSGDAILSGALLFLLLQQGGNAFAATVGFLFAALWAHTAYSAVERGSRAPTGIAFWKSQLLPWLALLGMSSGLALQHRYGQPRWLVLSGLGLVLLALPPLRSFVRSLRSPLLLFAGVLCVTLTLGIGKLVALSPVLAEADYAHAGNLPPSSWPAPPRGRGEGRSLDPDRYDENFYSSWGDLLAGVSGRAPKEGSYVPPPDPPPGRELLEPIDRRSATREYEYLGLTPGLCLLLLLGMVEAVRRREPRPLVLAAGAVAVCMGPHLLPDLHLLLAGGLPLLRSLSQPVKYYNFFLLLPLVLLLGLAARQVLEWAEGRGQRGLGWGVLVLLLAWPVIQNAPVWADRFAEPMPPWSCEGCTQVKQVGHPSWVRESRATIEEWSDRHRLRERRRSNQKPKHQPSPATSEAIRPRICGQGR